MANDRRFWKPSKTKCRTPRARQAFETAAIYRDALNQLSWLDRRLSGLRMAQNQLNGVLEIDARRKRTAWMILRGGKLVATVPKPDNPKRAIRAISAIENACSRKFGTVNKSAGNELAADCDFMVPEKPEHKKNDCSRLRRL